MKLVASLAALALSIHSVAASAAPPAACLSPSEVDALIRFSMPDVIGAVADQCAASLGPQSYLRRSRAQLVERFSSQSKAALPAARSAIGKLSGMPNADRLAEGTLRDLISVGVTGTFSKLKPADCVKADLLMTVLDPLPPANMAGLIGFLLQVGAGTANDKAKSAPFKICPNA